MGVFRNPASSRALRMAATRPSIMSEGAMMSMPARVRDTEVAASSSRVASLTISYSFTRAHEHRVNEGVRSQAGLAHQAAKFFGAAQTSKAGDGECHDAHWRTIFTEEAVQGRSHSTILEHLEVRCRSVRLASEMLE